MNMMELQHVNLPPKDPWIDYDEGFKKVREKAEDSIMKLVKYYRNQLDQNSVHIPSIIGPYGAGKTTLLEHLQAYLFKNGIPSIIVNFDELIKNVENKTSQTKLADQIIEEASTIVSNILKSNEQGYLSKFIRIGKDYFIDFKHILSNSDVVVVLVDEVEEGWRKVKENVSYETSPLRELYERVIKKTGNQKGNKYYIFAFSYGPTSAFNEFFAQAMAWRTDVILIPPLSFSTTLDLVKRKLKLDNDKIVYEVTKFLWHKTKGKVGLFFNLLNTEGDRLKKLAEMIQNPSKKAEDIVNEVLEYFSVYKGTSKDSKFSNPNITLMDIDIKTINSSSINLRPDERDFLKKLIVSPSPDISHKTYPGLSNIFFVANSYVYADELINRIITQIEINSQEDFMSYLRREYIRNSLLSISYRDENSHQDIIPCDRNFFRSLEIYLKSTLKDIFWYDKDTISKIDKIDLTQIYESFERENNILNLQKGRYLVGVDPKRILMYYPYELGIKKIWDDSPEFNNIINDINKGLMGQKTHKDLNDFLNKYFSLSSLISQTLRKNLTELIKKIDNLFNISNIPNILVIPYETFEILSSRDEPIKFIVGSSFPLMIVVTDITLRDLDSKIVQLNEKYNLLIKLGLVHFASLTGEYVYNLYEIIHKSISLRNGQIPINSQQEYMLEKIFESAISNIIIDLRKWQNNNSEVTKRLTPLDQFNSRAISADYYLLTMYLSDPLRNKIGILKSALSDIENKLGSINPSKYNVITPLCEVQFQQKIQIQDLFDKYKEYLDKLEEITRGLEYGMSELRGIINKLQNDDIVKDLAQAFNKLYEDKHKGFLSSHNLTLDTLKNLNNKILDDAKEFVKKILNLQLNMQKGIRSLEIVIFISWNLFDKLLSQNIYRPSMTPPNKKDIILNVIDLLNYKNLYEINKLYPTFSENFNRWKNEVEKFNEYLSEINDRLSDAKNGEDKLALLLLNVFLDDLNKVSNDVRDVADSVNRCIESVIKNLINFKLKLNEVYKDGDRLIEMELRNFQNSLSPFIKDSVIEDLLQKIKDVKEAENSINILRKTLNDSLNKLENVIRIAQGSDAGD